MENFDKRKKSENGNKKVNEKNWETEGGNTRG